MPAPPPTPSPPVTVSHDQPVPAEFDLLCESCGYSLVGLMIDRCPECGDSFDATQLPLARVPWLYRKRLGRASAYLGTLWLALFSPRTFAAELCRPVRISVSDAHRFRVMTITLGALAVFVGVAGISHATLSLWPPRPLTAGLLGISFAAFVGSLAILRLATDLPTFIWRGLPGNSEDLSPLHHYACAPLAVLMPVAVAFVALILVVQAPMVASRELTDIGALVLLAMSVPVVLWTWLQALLLMRTATRCSAGRVVALALYLPLHWLMSWTLVFLIAVAVTFYGSEAWEWWRRMRVF